MPAANRQDPHRPSRWTPAWRAALLVLAASAALLPPAHGEGPGGFKAAKAANARGMKAYRAKDFAAAAAAFREAIAADDNLVVAHYNLACVAALQGDKATVRAQLTSLKERHDEYGREKLRRGRTDPDLTAVASDPAIRKLLDEAAFAPDLSRLVAVTQVRATTSLLEGKGAAQAWEVIVPTESDGSETDQDIMFRRVWCEAQDDAGIGEGLAITFAAPVAIESVAIAAGDWRSPQHFRARNRITKLQIDFNDELELSFEPTRVEAKQTFKDSRELPWTEVELPKGPVRSLGVRIAKVKPGKKNDSCITEVQLLRGGQRLYPVFGVSAAALGALGPALTDLVDAMVSLDKGRLERHIQFPLPYCEKEDHSKSTCRDRPFKDVAALRAACASGSGCPEPAGPSQDAVVSSDGQTVVVRAASHEAWHLSWRDGRWRLTGIVDDYIQY